MGSPEPDSVDTVSTVRQPSPRSAGRSCFYTGSRLFGGGQQSGDEQHHCVYPLQRGLARHDFCHRLNHHWTHRPFRLHLQPVKTAGYPAEKYPQNGEASEGRGHAIRPVNCATFRAVHTTGADTGKNGRKFPFRATGNFWILLVINTNKPEDQLFASGIHKERNIPVCAALNGIVKIIKAQNLGFFFIKKVIFLKFHNIPGKFASLRGGFSFTGFS